MFIEEIELPSYDRELDYFTSLEHTTDMPLGYKSTRPFEFFPRQGIEKISLSRITLFCGSSNTPLDYLLRVIAAALGAPDTLPEDLPLHRNSYLRRCSVKYKKNKKRKYKCIYIGKQEITNEMEEIRSSFEFCGMKSMPELYEERLTEKNAIYVIEMPECGMSIEETAAFASLVYDTSKYTGAQFVISTNSPIIIGIKGAIIYDVDKRPLIPQPYYRSGVRKLFTRINDEICASHSRKKT